MQIKQRNLYSSFFRKYHKKGKNPSTSLKIWLFVGHVEAIICPCAARQKISVATEVSKTKASSSWLWLFEASLNGRNGFVRSEKVTQPLTKPREKPCRLLSTTVIPLIGAFHLNGDGTPEMYHQSSSSLGSPDDHSGQSWSTAPVRIIFQLNSNKPRKEPGNFGNTKFTTACELHYSQHSKVCRFSQNSQKQKTHLFKKFGPNTNPFNTFQS